MRPLLRPPLNRLIRDEPRVSSATQIAPVRVRPARDIALILIWHSEREPVDVDPAVDGEMKNVFVAVVQKSIGTDRLKMSERSTVDGDRFDPVNRVLKNE